MQTPQDGAVPDVQDSAEALPTVVDETSASGDPAPSPPTALPNHAANDSEAGEGDTSEAEDVEYASGEDSAETAKVASGPEKDKPKLWVRFTSFCLDGID